MSHYTIFHNPRCSKSRQTLQLLHDNNVQPDVRLYLEDAPTEAELRKLLDLLGLQAHELIRKGEEEYKTLNLSDSGHSQADLLAAMASHPRLLERPIVVRDGKAAIVGRPPENVLELLK